MNRDAVFAQAAQRMGHSFDGEILVGGRYVSLLRDGDTVYISGQIPRVGTQIVVTGRAGDDVNVLRAQEAARIGVMRALALVQRAYGSLACVRQVLRITVYVQCSSDFTQHSEVADGASDLLCEILGSAGTHTRTSVGVYQLPKNATVELDMVLALESGT
jgi:enamine deaminase RidA (YjgF/YER057c/UK114 family)